MSEKKLKQQIETFLEGVIEDIPGEIPESGNALKLLVDTSHLVNYLRDILTTFAKTQRRADGGNVVFEGDATELGIIHDARRLWSERRLSCPGRTGFLNRCVARSNFSHGPAPR